MGGTDSVLIEENSQVRLPPAGAQPTAPLQSTCTHMRTWQTIGWATLTVIGMALISLAHRSHLARSTANILPVAAITLSANVASPKTPADRAIQVAEAEITISPQRSEGCVSLANAYMRKVRESGDAEYYLRAEAAVRCALEITPDSFEGLRTLTWVQTGKHEFRAAQATAERLSIQYPEDPLVYGLLGDAAVELGEYESAEKTFEKMVDLHPGLASYSRISYIRELYGDVQGAIEMMTLAVKAGSRRDPEPLAWGLVQLGNLHFNQGHLQEAEVAHQKALAVFPHYYQALAALGRVRAAQQRYPEAIDLYQKAVAAVPAPDTIAALGDLFLLTGRQDEAEKQYILVEYIEHVNEINQITYTRQLALFYADHNRKLNEAVKLAEAERARRNDIYTEDALAWAYYKIGRFTDAWQSMKQALRLGTKDASLFFHAGMIAYGLGEERRAKYYLHRALETNPHFSLSGVELARVTLAEIEQRLVAQGEPHVR